MLQFMVPIEIVWLAYRSMEYDDTNLPLEYEIEVIKQVVRINSGSQSRLRNGVFVKSRAQIRRAIT